MARQKKPPKPAPNIWVCRHGFEDCYYPTEEQAKAACGYWHGVQEFERPSNCPGSVKYERKDSE